MANNIINYDDERLTSVEKEGQARKNEVTQNFNNMINERDTYTQQQQANIDNWAKQQTELQQAQTAHAIDKINQQKEQSAKDYTKEQKGAYTDYMKQSNDYGANAEMLARQGLQNSGYQESSKVNMWNAYQNRYASARESYKKAVLEYDNMIKDAELSNNETLANIAQEKLQKSLDIALQGFEYKNNLIIQRDNKIDEIDNTTHSRYQDVLAQINREYEYEQAQKQYEEEQRRYAEEQAIAQKQREEEQRRWQLEYEQQQNQIDRDYEMKMKDWELRQQQRRDANAQWDKEYALKSRETNATIARLNSQASSSNYGNGYALTDSSSSNTLSKNAKAAYNAFLIAKKVPVVGKNLTLENFLKTKYNNGSLSADEIRSIINIYG